MVVIRNTILALLALGASCLVSGGCSTTVKNPRAALADRSRHDSTHVVSLQELRNDPTLDAADYTLIEGVVWRPDYGLPSRREAINLLWDRDPERARVLLRRQLPRMTNWPWLIDLCEWIADRDIVELDPALISSWGRPRALTPDETKRPEYLALVRMHGKDKVPELVFDLFIESNKPSQRGLRQRCWDLLHRLGERERLIALATEVEPGGEDVMLADLSAAASTFGMVPYNREEILWLHKIRQPERAQFWDEAAGAVKELSRQRREELQMRDLATVVAVNRHRTDLMEAQTSTLYRELEKYLRTQNHYAESNPGIIGANDRLERLFTHRDKYTWGDLASMQLAIEAFHYPEVRSHVFDYADRDRLDESTEYGGILALDEQGRFEILEFLPNVRHHDRKFLASQEMFDAGYTGLFHFHFHAESHSNSDHAGPGLGDMNYADSTRANCLVLTFVDVNRMNLDFYRHDGVIVDLGTISRPRS
ncbi:MAG: hypothetical protein VX908_03115 [Planctomycetota bacterium]|nr:hypothetical protein [Planctomycetota bacterium]